MRKQLPALTSLRFFAAAMIVIQHTAGYFHIWESFAGKFVLSQGVTFFFVLSGFILTYAHPNLSGFSSSMKFIWARIARVWPAHAATMLVFYILWAHVLENNYSPTPEQTYLNLFLLQSWSQLPYTFFGFNGVAWSLSTEMFFYAMFPILLINIDKTWPHLLIISASLAGFSMLMAHHYNLTSFTGANIPNTASWVYIWPPSRLLEFVLGMVAGKAFLNYGDKFGRMDRQTAIGAAGIFVMLFGAVAVPAAGRLITTITSFDLALVSWLLVSGAAPFFAAGLFLIASTNGKISDALSWRPLILLGEISFSIYLVHQIIIRALIEHPSWLASWPAIVKMLAYWALTLTLSYLLWRFIEKPCQRALMSFLRSPARAAVA